MAERIYKPGDIIASIYEVRKIFAGGMGEVYLAYHRERKKFYALKTIQEKFFRSKEDFLAFRREAEVWIMLGKHPNIVHAISLRDFDGRLFLVLEYIEPDTLGRNTLSDYFVGDPISNEQILVWALHFCDGMIYAQSRGLKCHRDICPRNIMITKDMVAQITDFGLAKTVYSAEPLHSGNRKDLNSVALGRYDITIFGNIAGKPAYISPEALDDYRNADGISDIYSFGVVLFQMLSGGERPFNAFENFSAYKKLHQQNVPLPELDNPLFPVVKRCLARRRNERYQSPAELRRELENYYRKLVGAEPPSPMKVSMTAHDIRHFSQALFELKHYEEALKNCDMALKMEGKDHETWDLRGRICHALKRHDEALKTFDESLKIKPDHYAPWNNKGIVFQEQKKTDDALSCFRKVVSLRPDYREAWNNIGACLQMQGKLEEAIKHYQTATELDPRYRDAWLNMGDCFIILQKYPKALECYERAEEVDPYNQYTLENLEKLYQVLGFPDKADFIHAGLGKGGGT